MKVWSILFNQIVLDLISHFKVVTVLCKIFNFKYVVVAVFKCKSKKKVATVLITSVGLYLFVMQYYCFGNPIMYIFRT